MRKILAIPVLLALALGPVAVAKDHGDRDGEHDSRDFGHSRGKGHGKNWGYEEHDRRDFGHSRGRGRGRGLARNQQRYCNPNGFYDNAGNWYPDPNCGTRQVY